MARGKAEGYPVRFEREEDGGYVVTLPDIGYGATQGDTLGDALAQAEDLLQEAILGMMAHGEAVPLPSPAKGRPTVALPALTAGQARSLSRDARRRAQQEAARRTPRLAALAGDAVVRRPPRLAARPDRGRPEGARPTPGGEQRSRVSRRRIRRTV